MFSHINEIECVTMITPAMYLSRRANLYGLGHASDQCFLNFNVPLSHLGRLLK